MGIDGDPTQGKRKGEETSNPMVNTKSTKGKQSHQPPTSKTKKLTSNIRHALQNQCRKFISLLINPSIVFQRHYGSSPSFIVSRSPAGLAYRLLEPLDLCVLQKEGLVATTFMINQ